MLTDDFQIIPGASTAFFLKNKVISGGLVKTIGAFRRWYRYNDRWFQMVLGGSVFY